MNQYIRAMKQYKQIIPRSLPGRYGNNKQIIPRSLPGCYGNNIKHLDIAIKILYFTKLHTSGNYSEPDI